MGPAYLSHRAHRVLRDRHREVKLSSVAVNRLPRTGHASIDRWAAARDETQTQQSVSSLASKVKPMNREAVGPLHTPVLEYVHWMASLDSDRPRLSSNLPHTSFVAEAIRMSSSAQVVWLSEFGTSVLCKGRVGTPGWHCTAFSGYPPRE